MVLYVSFWWMFIGLLRVGLLVGYVFIKFRLLRSKVRIVRVLMVFILLF